MMNRIERPRHIYEEEMRICRDFCKQREDKNAEVLPEEWDAYRMKHASKRLKEYWAMVEDIISSQE